MKILSYLLPLTIMTLLTGFGRQTANPAKLPMPGTSRTIVVPVEYYSGVIEGSGAVATWPVAKFAADPAATAYSVKELKSGKTYSWNYDEKTVCAYHVFPSSNDIKDGNYYVGLGRTWSGEATVADIAWKVNYDNLYGQENQLEITFYY